MPKNIKQNIGVKMYWYILFVKTGMEKKVVQFINKTLDELKFSPFIPELETLFKMSGKIKKEIYLNLLKNLDNTPKLFRNECEIKFE